MAYACPYGHITVEVWVQTSHIFYTFYVCKFYTCQIYTGILNVLSNHDFWLLAVECLCLGDVFVIRKGWTSSPSSGLTVWSESKSKEHGLLRGGDSQLGYALSEREVRKAFFWKLTRNFWQVNLVPEYLPCGWISQACQSRSFEKLAVCLKWWFLLLLFAFSSVWQATVWHFLI